MIRPVLEYASPLLHPTLTKSQTERSFIWYINLDRSFYRFVTIHACDRQTDRQTDGQTEFSSLDRICIPCSAVKSGTNCYISKDELTIIGRDVFRGTGRPEQEIARNGEDSQAEILRSHITPRLTGKRHYAGNDARPSKTRRAAQAVDR